MRHTESERERDSGRLWEDSRGLAWRRSRPTFSGAFERTVDGIGGMCLQECALALLPVVLARRYATLSDQRQRQLLRRLFLRVKELPNGMHGSEHGNRRERALAQRRSGRARKGDPRGLRTSRSLNDSRELGVRRIGRPSVDMSRKLYSRLSSSWVAGLWTTEGNQFRLREFDEAKCKFQVGTWK